MWSSPFSVLSFGSALMVCNGNQLNGSDRYSTDAQLGKGSPRDAYDRGQDSLDQRSDCHGRDRRVIGPWDHAALPWATNRAISAPATSPEVAVTPGATFAVAPSIPVDVAIKWGRASPGAAMVSAH